MTITISTWIFPVIWTLISIGWLFTRKYGTYDFGVLFDFPAAIGAILLGWLIYFIIV